MLGSHHRGRFSHVGRHIQVVDVRGSHKDCVVIGRYVGPSLAKATPEKSDLGSQKDEPLTQNVRDEVHLKAADGEVDLLGKPLIFANEKDLKTTNHVHASVQSELISLINSAGNVIGLKNCNFGQKGDDLCTGMQTSNNELQTVAFVELVRNKKVCFSFRKKETNENLKRQTHQTNMSETTINNNNSNTPQRLVRVNNKTSESGSIYISVNDSIPSPFQQTEKQDETENSHYCGEPNTIISRLHMEENHLNELYQIESDNWTGITNSLRLQVDHYSNGFRDKPTKPTSSEEFNYIVEESDASTRIPDFRSSSPSLSTSSDWTSNSRPSDVTLDYFLRTDDVFYELTSDDEQVTVHPGHALA